MPWIGPHIGLGRRRREAVAAYIAAMAVAPSASVQSAIRTFIDTLIVQGLWPKIAIGYLLNLHTEQASRLNFKSPSRFTIVDTFNPPTWVSGVGGAGGFTAAASSPLSTQWTTFDDGGTIVTSTSAGATIRSRTAALSTAFDFGDSSRVHGRLRTTNDIFQGRVMSASTFSSPNGSSTDASGIFHFLRVDAANAKVRRNKVDAATVANANTSTNTGAVCICGVAGSSTSIRRQSFFAVHGSLSDAEADILHDAIDAFDTAIGAT